MSELALQLIREAKEKKSTFLDLGECGLTEIPEQVFEMDWLEGLNLGIWSFSQDSNNYLITNNKSGRNSITIIPEEIRNLKRLQTLSLTGNNITDINALKELVSISALSLSQNQISDISALNRLTYLSKLDISKNQISDISALYGLTSLSELYLSRNQVGNISVLRGLTSLSKLDLSGNQISNINALKELTSLYEVSLYDNQISDVSPLKGLVPLTKLGLSNNQIMDISALRELRSLNMLDLSHNRISDIRTLKGLIENGVRVEFKVDYVLAAKAGYFDANRIILEGNPLTTPPPEIVKQGNEAVLNYFKELEEKGAEYLYEGKLLIIGEGGAGKTTLARKLVDENAPMPEEKDTTKGISIEPCYFQMPNGKRFRMNIWDFGGQEIYHATHQFFLTKRSLYVLLDDTRKDDKTVNHASFNYWLQVAGLFGGGSPLLIVQNEKSGRSKELDLGDMKGRFPFIQDRLATNLLRVGISETLEKVKEAIQFYIQRLPHVGEELPRNWITIRKELETLANTKDYISLEDYFSICARHDLVEEEGALHLSSYLHDLGSFLHFQEDLALRNILTWTKKSN